MMNSRVLLTLLIIGSAFFFNSCASVPLTHLPPPISAGRSDMMHTVGPGETFWRISKMYDVPIATILQANNLSNPENLEMGQKLVIPQAASPKPIVALFPSKKWRYIIIHHSGTHEGSSLAFHKSHLNKGWDKGVGYHFVIDNDSDGKIDGQIEQSPRWIKQQDGAHCKAADMNYKAIGICLVGNFNQEKISKKQMDSLVYLVNKLRAYYNIPVSHILGHGYVEGAATDCPGKYFSWRDFQQKLLFD